jgi:hypothetical protein
MRARAAESSVWLQWRPLFLDCIFCHLIDGKFEKLTGADFKELDSLSGFMVNPDANFDILGEIWNTHKKYRILDSPLVGDWDNGTEG